MPPLLYTAPFGCPIPSPEGLGCTYARLTALKPFGDSRVFPTKKLPRGLFPRLNTEWDKKRLELRRRKLGIFKRFVSSHPRALA